MLSMVGICIGCGACSYTSRESVEIVEDEYRQYQGRIKPGAKSADLNKALEVCPFSNNGPNEDQISEEVF